MFLGILSAAFFEKPVLVAEALKAQVEAFAQRRIEIDHFKVDLTKDCEVIRADLDQQQNGFRLETDQLLKNGDKLIQEKCSAFDSALNTHADAFTTTLDDWKKTVSALETAYSEKLRLEKPAEYWQDLEKLYLQRGNRWVWVAAIVLAVLVTICLILVYKPPDVLNDPKFSLGSVKGAVILTAALSMIIYFLALIVRLVTSAFHLASDARERFQMTYVFLALLKEKAMDDKDRQIVLTALFSRADTGLLKYDSSPSMPTPMGAIFDAIKPNK